MSSIGARVRKKNLREQRLRNIGKPASARVPSSSEKEREKRRRKKVTQNLLLDELNFFKSEWDKLQKKVDDLEVQLSDSTLMVFDQETELITEEEEPFIEEYQVLEEVFEQESSELDLLLQPIGIKAVSMVTL